MKEIKLSGSAIAELDVKGQCVNISEYGEHICRLSKRDDINSISHELQKETVNKIMDFFRKVCKP